MRFFSIALLVSGLLVLVGGRSLLAEGWSLDSLNPFTATESDDARVAKRSVQGPSPLESVQTGTKKFFTTVKDAVTPEKKSEKKRVHPWLRQPEPRLKRQPPEKESWFGSLFKPKKPEVPKSLDEWMSLKRQDP